MTNDSPQGFTHHYSNLFLLLGRKDIEQSIQRPGGIARVQRCQNKMASLGRGDGEGNRLQIAHFSNHDHIWILPQRSAQRSSEGFGVGEHFPLGNVTVFDFRTYSIGSSSVMM